MGITALHDVHEADTIRIGFFDANVAALDDGTDQAESLTFGHTSITIFHNTGARRIASIGHSGRTCGQPFVLLNTDLQRHRHRRRRPQANRSVSKTCWLGNGSKWLEKCCRSPGNRRKWCKGDRGACWTRSLTWRRSGDGKGRWWCGGYRWNGGIKPLRSWRRSTLDRSQ